MAKQRLGFVDRDKMGVPLCWKQKIRGEWKRFPFIAGFDPNHDKARAKAESEFNMIFPIIERKCVLAQVHDALYDEILHDFIPRWAEQKKKEGWLGGLDADDLLKRGLTGFLGEAVMESFLGVPVLDRDKDGRIAVGDSKVFRGADLAKGTGLDVGIKTAEVPKFHTAKRNVRRPQVLCFRVSDREFYVGGYASIKVQRECFESRYVLNDNLRNKRIWNGQIEKSAFWGLHRIKQFRNLEDLKRIYYEKG